MLPNTEKTILISADATDFEMDAISINGVRLSLDIDVDDSELTEQTDKIVDAGEQLDDGAQELLDGASELADHTRSCWMARSRSWMRFSRPPTTRWKPPGTISASWASSCAR